MAPSGPAIGIDLGTAYTCVAVYRNGQPEIIPHHGLLTMPSVVAFTSTTRLIGAAAKSQANANPTNTIFDALRWLWHDFDSDEIQKLLKQRYPFTVVRRDGQLKFRVEYRGSTVHVSPAEIVSMILTSARENAEAYLGTPIRNAVLTTPSVFRYRERQMLRDIARVAGLNVLYMLEGPTAAAMYYCERSESQEERNILFYDLGAGSLGLTLVTVEGGILDVKAVAGNRSLGGTDFDYRVLDYYVESFGRETGSVDAVLENPRCLSRLRIACERAKRELTSRKETVLEVDSLRNGIDFRATLKIPRLEHLCQDLFWSTFEPIERILRDSKMDKSSIHEIVMIGGSSRIPRLQKMVSSYFLGRDVNRSLNVDEAVACGASILAAIFSGANEPQLNETLLLDCTAVTLRSSSIRQDVVISRAC